MYSVGCPIVTSPLPINRPLFRKVLECGGKGVKGARYRFGKRAHDPRMKAASPFAPVAPELCRRTPKRGHDWTNPFRFMGSKRGIGFRGILSPSLSPCFHPPQYCYGGRVAEGEG